MTDVEYLELRQKSDSRPMDEIHSEALSWNSHKVPQGNFRRTAHEDFIPGDLIIKTWDEWLD